MTRVYIPSSFWPFGSHCTNLCYRNPLLTLIAACACITCVPLPQHKHLIQQTSSIPSTQLDDTSLLMAAIHLAGVFQLLPSIDYRLQDLVHSFIKNCGNIPFKVGCIKCCPLKIWLQRTIIVLLSQRPNSAKSLTMYVRKK